MTDQKKRHRIELTTAEAQWLMWALGLATGTCAEREAQQTRTLVALTNTVASQLPERLIA